MYEINTYIIYRQCIVSLSTIVGLIVGIDREICGFHKKRTWINSSVIESIEKPAMHLLVQIYQC